MVFYRVGIKAPDLGQNGLLGHILPLCLQKIPHHVEFPRGQPQLPLPADQRPGRQIERRVAERERVDLRTLPPEQRTDAGQQLPRVKGLREIIIRARVQPLNAVLKRRLCCQHQNRRPTALRAHLPRDLIAVHARHHHVENEQIIYARLGIFRPRLAVMHRLDGKSLPLQHGPERVRKQDLVFNDQNFHIIIPQVQIAGKWYGGIQGEALCASYPYQLYSFFYRFSRKTAEKLSPGQTAGRQERCMLMPFRSAKR